MALHSCAKISCILSANHNAINSSLSVFNTSARILTCSLFALRFPRSILLYIGTSIRSADANCFCNNPFCSLASLILSGNSMPQLLNLSLFGKYTILFDYSTRYDCIYCILNLIFMCRRNFSNFSLHHSLNGILSILSCSFRLSVGAGVICAVTRSTGNL